MTNITTIKRTTKYIGKATITTAAERVAEETGYEFVGIDTYAGYSATFKTDTGTTVGTIIRIDCEECGKDACPSVDIVFGSGCFAHCSGGHAHEITEDFFNNEGFMDIR
jgi:hypothetical protein